MSCASTCNNCCPEAPAITVNAYSVTLGGTGANFHSDVRGLGDSGSGAGLVFTLGYTPVQSAGVVVTLNGSVQRPSIDFTLTGTTLTMAEAIVSGDVLQIHYLGTT